MKMKDLKTYRCSCCDELKKSHGNLVWCTWDEKTIGGKNQDDHSNVGICRTCDAEIRKAGFFGVLQYLNSLEPKPKRGPKFKPENTKQKRRSLRFSDDDVNNTVGIDPSFNQALRKLIKCYASDPGFFGEHFDEILFGDLRDEYDAVTTES